MGSGPRRAVRRAAGASCRYDPSLLESVPGDYSAGPVPTDRIAGK